MQSIAPHVIGESLDVWLKFDPHAEDDDTVEAEANTYRTETGFRIEWYLNSVGLVTGVEFDTLEEAHAWYKEEGFDDYTA